MSDLHHFLWKSAAGEPGAAPLRVGFLVEQGPVEKWVADCLSAFREQPQLETVVFRLPPASIPEAGFALKRFEQNMEPSPLLARTALAGPDVSVAPAPDGSLPQESARLLSESGCDVLIALGVSGLRGPAAGLARAGVWTLQLEDSGLGAGGYAFFRNLHRGRPDVTLRLLEHRSVFERGSLLCSWNAAHDSEILYSANMGILGSVATALFFPILSIALGANREASGDEIAALAPGNTPGAFSVASLVTRAVASKIRRKLQGRDRERDEWFAAWRTAETQGPPNAAGKPWTHLRNFPGHGSADPFPVRSGNGWVLFYEDIPPHGRGRLAGVELSGDGQTGDPFVILERPYHLSYPLVFEHDGEKLMLPESGADRSVQLFRATEFPRSWEQVRVLIDGVQLVDTTPLFHEGRWYFFTALPASGSYFGLLFTAETLEAPWRLHPASPISTDIRNSRPAGHVLRAGDALYRPVQNGWPHYGSAMEIRQILELTPTRFHDRRVGTIDPDWAPGLCATHTFNRCETLEGIDGRGFV